jgi:hypothetical protein
MRNLWVMAVTGLALATHVSMAQTFDSGIPAGWTTVGTAGTLGANGVVSLAPGGGSAYGYVSTAGSSVFGIGYGLGSEQNGSTLTSQAFTASAGTPLQFSFNFVTSDGGNSDYAYANLVAITGDSQPSIGGTIGVLFDARAEPSGTIAPGVGLPTPLATLTPSSVPIIPGGPSWAPLGSSSGQCYDAGCGFTGWIQSTYDIAAAGTYELQFGVTNWLNTGYDTGLAFDGITVGGAPIVSAGGGPMSAPEIDPASAASGLTLLLGGLVVLGGRRQTKQVRGVAS